MVDLSIVIVSWNVRDLLRRCLQSVVTEAQPSPDDGVFRLGDWEVEILVVDNASTDGSSEMVRDEFPQILLIANDENRGFTAANNQGLALSQGRYLLLLNPDTEIVGDALAAMIGYAQANGEVGALGPRLLNTDSSPQSSRRRFPTFSTALVESTVVQEWWDDNRILRRYYMADTPDDAIQRVDWVVGACLLVRRQAYEQVGGLDEGFFMYSEELDWCRRIKSAGWESSTCPPPPSSTTRARAASRWSQPGTSTFRAARCAISASTMGIPGEALRWFLL